MDVTMRKLVLYSESAAPRLRTPPAGSGTALAASRPALTHTCSHPIHIQMVVVNGHT